MSQDSNENKKEEEKKTVTIRGVDQELYNRLNELAKRTGKTVGELTNQAYKIFLGVTDTAKKVAITAVESGKSLVEGFKETAEIVTVSDVDEIEITKDEIRGLDKPVAFRNVKKLVFVGIDDSDLEKIKEIVGVDEVVIPKGVNKIKLLQKCRMVKRVTQAS
ncbi:MAG: hypothetical protein MPF33_02510 [Candidatus Aramenus sp.]|jgi:hypothetical protein|nr:hypothetical protein [Candidatus Aramenus sp.]